MRQRVAFGTSVFVTESGWCGLAWTEQGIFASTLPESTWELAAASLAATLGRLGIVDSGCRLEETAPARTAQAWMKDYFAGGESEPDILLDMSLMSDWQRRAGQTMMQVPRGQVRTYSWLAASMGAPAAPRAAGTACARNPLPVIVPCHRIIRSSGGLGGFGGGLALKRRMLEMEGAGV